MKLSDFYVGLEFIGSAGFRWRCTDVGTRTILAIQLARTDSIWFQGPPYIVNEVVFDEFEMPRCRLVDDGPIASAIDERAMTSHPGYPSKAMLHMLEAQVEDTYPNRGVLRFDRCRPDGEILHPYAGRYAEGSWLVELYLPFLDCYEAMPESDFIALPLASEQDIRSRACSSGDV